MYYPYVFLNPEGGCFSRWTLDWFVIADQKPTISPLFAKCLR